MAHLLVARVVLRRTSQGLAAGTSYGIRFRSNRIRNSGPNRTPDPETPSPSFDSKEPLSEPHSALSDTPPSGKVSYDDSNAKSATDPLTYSDQNSDTPSGGASRSALYDTPPSGKSSYDSAKFPVELPHPPPPPEEVDIPLPPPSSSSNEPASPASDVPPRPPPSNTPLSHPPSEATFTPMSNALSLDFSAGEEPAGREEGRTGAKSSEGSLTSLEKKRRRVLRIFFGSLFAGLCMGVIHLGRPWEPEELNRKSPAAADAGRWGRTKHRFKVFTGLFVEPIREEILPPRPPGQYPPYILLISLDDLLITSTWDRQHGWRTAKRPGFDYFMGYLSNWYEIIIFTTQPEYTAGPIVEKLDPLHVYIMGLITREYTRYHDGQLVKDISNINRDLSKVVAVDTDASRYALHPDNVIAVPKWDGDPKDNGLIALIPFLESLAIYNAPDVCPILKQYKGKDVVAEYAKVEAEQKRRHLEAWNRGGKGEIAPPSWLARLFSFGGHTSTSSYGPPPTYLEKKRKEAQEYYLANVKYWKDHEEEIKKIHENLREQQIKELGPMSLSKVFTGLFWGEQSKDKEQPKQGVSTTVVPITGK